MPSWLPSTRLDLVCVQAEMKLIERRAVAYGVENWNSTIGALRCLPVCLSGSRQLRAARAHGRPCIWGFRQRDLVQAGGLQQKRALPRRLLRSRMAAVELEHAGPQLHCNLSVPCVGGFCKLCAPPNAERTAAVLMPLWACAEKGFKAGGARSKRLVFGCGGWWESWTWSWSDDRPTMLGAKNGKETVCPIMRASRGRSRVSARHRNPPADASCDGAGFQTRSRRASGCHCE